MSIRCIILPIAILLCVATVWAQPGAVPANLHNNLTVLYDITISNHKKNAGIEETYNGGIKTIMVQNSKARVRLVSLMRIQSHYFFKNDSGLAKVLITKESGKKKYKYRLSAAGWKQYNVKYDSITCTFLDDTKSIAGYNCKKAIVTVPGLDKEVIIYYSPELTAPDKHIEPLFAKIPGLVLHYVTEGPNGSISFTAKKISFDPLDEGLFQEPVNGYAQKNYIASER
ncbi:MAG: hypothetical protein JNM14_13360 [Ferruginibacter sp.]|nr:hypothetical protein [Ferruginibacter sp.]